MSLEDCVFCKIIKNEIPSYKVWEDQDYLAFLTIQPVKEGHTLVIPKKHDPYLFDIGDKEIGDLFIATKKVSKLLQKTLKPKSGRIGVLVMGLEAPHVHVHLIPVDQEGDLKKPAKMATSEQLKKTHQQILATS